MPARHSPTLGAMLCTLLAVCAGCSGLFQNDFASSQTSAKSLPALAAAADAIQLEVLFAERPVGDRLLRDLWRNIDQTGALNSSVRTALSDNCLRIGVAGSSPPRELQSLLGMKTKSDPQAAGDQISGRRFWLRSGGETTVQASPVYSKCTVELVSNGRREMQEFEDARCIFRVRAHRVQDGWVKLEVTPEIHHGDFNWRPQAGEFRWDAATSQEVKPLYGQKFELTLNVGELVVITASSTANPANDASVGRRFFIGADDSTSLQRVLVLRLADLGQAQPLYAEK